MREATCEIIVRDLDPPAKPAYALDVVFPERASMAEGLKELGATQLDDLNSSQRTWRAHPDSYAEIKTLAIRVFSRVYLTVDGRTRDAVTGTLIRESISMFDEAK
jgi:hypothetical protein